MREGRHKVVSTACPRESSVALGTACRFAVGRSPTAVESGAPKAELLRRSFIRAPTAIFPSPGFWPSRLGAGDLSSHIGTAPASYLSGKRRLVRPNASARVAGAAVRILVTDYSLAIRWDS